MSGRWEIGDLAECIRVVETDKRAPVVGCIYTVSNVTFGGMGLQLGELPCVCSDCGSVDHCASWRADLFRKVPPKKEAQRFDFRRLLSPTKRKQKELEPA